MMMMPSNGDPQPGDRLPPPNGRSAPGPGRDAVGSFAAPTAGATSGGAARPASSPGADAGPRYTATAADSFIIPLCAVFRRHLRQAGQKFTSERAQVLDAIIQINRVFEPDELRNAMRERGLKVSKATIYRTLRLLVDAELVEQIPINPKQIHYRLAYGEPPQDQMVCVATGRVVHFSAPELLTLRQRIAAEFGWSAVGHRFQIFALSEDADADADPDADAASGTPGDS